MTEEAAQNPGLKLLIPEDIRYNCQGCGRCCSGWSVGLTEEDYSRVKNTDWQSLHPELKDKEVFFHREKEFLEGTAAYPHYTKPRDDGSCPFLIDNLCFIHSHLGEYEKPITCRVFPYSFVETPSGVYTGVVYNSMASVRNIGAPLTEQREKLAEYFNLSIQHKNASMRPGELESQLKARAEGTMVAQASPFSEISLTPACKLTWEEYLLIEERMLKLILERLRQDEPTNIFNTLLQCAEILMQGRKLKVTGGSVADITQFEPDLKKPADPVASGTELMTLRMLYYRFFIYPTVRTSDTGLWQMQRNRAFEPKVAAIVVRAFSKYISSGLNTILMARAGNLPMLGNADLNAALTKSFAPLDQETDKLFHRWLYLKLFAKSYFGPAAAGFSVLSGFNCLTASILSVLLFAKAAALHAGRNNVAIADIYESYWRLDRELLTMGQTPEQESKFYNSGLSSPRLFNKSLWTMARSFGTDPQTPGI
ncbi:MAG: YkgJ family cysteine cluster protein [Cyanobacteria bacterium SZAS LIN-2]|nr:YkgJ family cysteine cluster protein [Cyanobacteria bacterium SZAS LIN-3]MBS1995963.1 YkgJ family cysteine cluster protein [Cyanobacteria bacterium SZAS LIN-2]MBS2010035.1 YkgJ family cysteine cluster protein [Cyanobacteria bacterium SZAS TMP-1]